MEFVKNRQSFLQSYNKSLINKLSRDRTGRISALGLFCTDLAALSKPRANILPVRPSRLVNKMYIIVSERGHRTGFAISYVEPGYMSLKQYV